MATKTTTDSRRASTVTAANETVSVLKRMLEHVHAAEALASSLREFGSRSAAHAWGEVEQTRRFMEKAFQDDGGHRDDYSGTPEGQWIEERELAFAWLSNSVAGRLSNSLGDAVDQIEASIALLNRDDPMCANEAQHCTVTHCHCRPTGW